MTSDHNAPADGENATRPAATTAGADTDRAGSAAIPAALEQARKTIDNLDAALIHILAERFRCTQQVGHIKAQHDLPPADPQREAWQVKRLQELAKTAGLDPEFAQKLLQFIVTEVIQHHLSIKANYQRGRDQQGEK